MIQIAVFASGSGTNAQNIAETFLAHPVIRISLIISNKADALVLERAERMKIPSVVITAAAFREGSHVLEVLKAYKIDFIVLAGFLLLLPPALIREYPGRIINIHPALLPGYGGKGMYGRHVHEAVLAAGDKESGISIHFVNESYDEGRLIFQARCPVYESDTPDTLAERVHRLEYAHYPRIVEKLVMKMTT